MKQTSLGSGFELSSKRTRKREFLDEMQRVVPWRELVSLIESHKSSNGRGRPAFATEVMLRIHFLQQWFNLSDPAMEEALYDTPLFTHFAQLDPGHGQRHPQREEPVAAARHGGRCHRASLRRARPRTKTVPETARCTRVKKATSGTLA